MKICPNCKQTYTDDDLNFCLNDGGILTAAEREAPPTVFMNQARPTGQNVWGNSVPNAAWENRAIGQKQPFAPALWQSSDQTLPTISLVLGIFAVVLSVCCYAGIPLGLAAVITGFIGMNNAKSNSSQYGGRGLAIGGLITGGIGFLISAGMLLFVIIAGSL